MGDISRFISTDSHGVLRVAGTRISIDSVVIGFQQGQSPEEIQRNFSSLTLEQVYGVITYYLGHPAEIDEYLRHQDAVWEKARAKAEQHPSAALQRLREMRKAQAEQPR
jgi:uncharacterized protein (DUF433 family)